MQVPVQLENVKLFVIFKLVGAVLGYFNHRAENLGGAVANGQLQVINHASYSPSLLDC
jgi:hypothetical protein